MEKGTSGFGKTQCTQVVKTIWVQRILLTFTFISLIVKAIIERMQKRPPISARSGENAGSVNKLEAMSFNQKCLARIIRMI
jgi:hypothetical protein